MIWIILWCVLLAANITLLLVYIFHTNKQNKILKKNLAAITHYAEATEEQNKLLKNILNIKDTED